MMTDATTVVATSQFEPLSEFDKVCYTNLNQDLMDALRKVSGNGQCTFHYAIYGSHVQNRDARKVLHPLGWEASRLRLNADESPRLMHRLKFLIGILQPAYPSLRVTPVYHPAFISQDGVVELKIEHRGR